MTGRRVGAGAVAIVVALAATQLFPGVLPAGIVMQGALLGSLTGLLALGLVLIYRTTRVVNFAYGTMGGLPAAAAATMYLGHGWPWPLAIAATVAVGAAVGAGIERVVIRRFAEAPRLVLTVASIGLAQILGGVELFEPRWLRGPTFITSFDTGLSRLHTTVGPVLFTGNDLVLIGVVPAVIAALSWFLLRTDSGVAVRAIAENTDRARLLGVPARRLSLAVWALAGGLAGLAVLLQAPSQGIPLDAAAGPAILLAPLAAAVVARFESLGVAFAAGIGLGVVDQVVRWNVAKQSIETVVFLAVILVALASQQRGKGRADAPDESSWSASGLLHAIPAHLGRLPEVRWARRGVSAGLIVAVIAVPFAAGPSMLDRISVGLIFGLAALSLVVLSGWGGAVSLGQMALVGVGGVVAGDLMVHLNLDLFLAVALAAGASGLVALVVGLPALRARGLYLAVTTLAFAVAVDSFFFNPANFSSALPHGLIRPVLWKRFDLHSERTLYFVCLGALAFAVVCARGVRQARPGRALLAARDNWRAAEAAAVPTTRVRLGAFVLSGTIAGVAGALYVVLLGTVGYHTFPPPDSILVFSMAVIGGLGSIWGALCGVALIQVVGVLVPRLQLILTGTGLLVVLMVFPAGIAGALERLRDAAVSVVARRRGLARTAWSSAAGEGAASARAAPAVPGRPVAESKPATPGLLRCAALDASYGPLQVLFGVDLDVGEGEILALLGTNGAGKSTLLRAVTGLLASSGEIRFAGENLSGRTPEQIAAAGVTLMPGGRGVFPALTVEENLRVASWLIRRDRAQVAAARERVTTMFPVLRSRSTTQAANLSGGEQQMLSLAMAFFVPPRLLCIDELSLGLAPAVVSRLIESVREIHRRGTTIVIVEQSVDVALMVAQRAVFMEKGEVRFTGPTADLLDRPDLLRAIFISDQPGAGQSEPAPARSGVALECAGLSKSYGGVRAVSGVDLTVAPGEIVGLIGHNGAGKTTLFDLISGFLTPDAGRVVLGGVDLTSRPPYVRSRQRLGRSFQEARLFPNLTVAETLAVALERHLACRGLVAAALRLPASTDTEAAVGERVDELIDVLGLHAFRDRPVAELSTGTRRVVELACMLAHEPDVLLLDEPSAGVAQRESEALGALLRRVTESTGCSLVIIEHDIGLLRSLCDRFVALELGEVIATGPPEQVLSDPAVIASYLGDASLQRSSRTGALRQVEPDVAPPRARKPSRIGGR